MSNQTFLPSVSTLLSKDSVPVAVVTSVLDLEQLLDNLFYKYFDVNVIGCTLPPKMPTRTGKNCIKE